MRRVLAGHHHVWDRPSQASWVLLKRDSFTVSGRKSSDRAREETPMRCALLKRRQIVSVTGEGGCNRAGGVMWGGSDEKRRQRAGV